MGKPARVYSLGFALFAVVGVSACGPGGSGRTGECTAAETDCSGACTDTKSDPDNCGGCGVQCSTGEVCDGAGDCSSDCTGGLSACSGACVDTNTNVSHCGGCDKPCTNGDMCDGSGNCTSDCPDGTSICGGGCVDLNIDRDNCGMCGRQCTGSQLCSAGDCMDDSCTEATSEAQSGVLPADIIVVVDNSGSMTDEAASVQASMNDFVSVITTSMIDAHVILISSDSGDTQGICVPGPVGSGSCPGDEKLPAFRHVVTNVGSTNALQLIISTYPQWQGSLRAVASKTVLVITDDDAALGNGLDAAGTASKFIADMVALNPTFQGFKFNGIIAPYDLNGLTCLACANSGNCAMCDVCCGANLGLLCTPLPASEGTVYKQLVSMTSGIEGNLCIQDFLPAFQAMATAVVSDAQVSCIYDIPDPGNGMNIDFGRVNVDYQPTPASPVTTFPNIPNGLAGCGASGGWYYDDPSSPSQVLLCPATCADVQANTEAKITVKFGCATIVN